jgi:hypothetical protein
MEICVEMVEWMIEKHAKHVLLMFEFVVQRVEMKKFNWQRIAIIVLMM